MQRQNDALKKIDELSFAADELRLFLDTHPGNIEAIKKFNEYCIKRKAEIEKYNAEFEVLDAYSPISEAE